MLIFSHRLAYFDQRYHAAFKSTWLIILVALLLIINPALAQEPILEKPSDIRIIVDISGSMKKNDPKNLRMPAVDMLSKLLPDGSKAGIWTFGQFVNMLVKHREVDQSWKQDASAKSSGISSVGQYTNIGEALEKTAYDKTYSSIDQYQTHVILMTDGMVDIDRDPKVNERERSRIINEILPSYQKAGFIIHTISLSDKADKKLMDKLALATGGQSVVAETADELMEIFLQIFNRAVPQEELPFEGNSFLTDSSIEEFTALIFREPTSPETTLFAPDKSAYTKDIVSEDVSWYRTDKYDLITLKQPLEGEWQVLADLQPNSRITVVSDLSLSVKSIPSNLMVNDIVDFSLVFREGNEVVDRAEFLELLDINLTIEPIALAAGSKEKWSKKLSNGLVPGNGVYKTLLDNFTEVGEYDVIVDVDGKTFQRRSVQRVNVRTPFKIETQTINTGDATQFNIEVIPQSASVNFANTEVVAKIKPPTDSSLIKPFELNDNQVWALSIKPEAEGIYSVTIRVTTKDSNGDTNDIIPETLTFSFPVVDNIFEEQKNVVEDIVETPVIEDAPKVEEVKPEEPKELEANADEEAAVEPQPPEKNDSNMMQWILYGVIGLVNLIILGGIFFLYRKFVNPKEAKPENSEDDVIEKEQVATSAMDELPMDEMVIDELDAFENDIDLAEEDSVEKAVSASDALADLAPEILDDDLSDDLIDDAESDEFKTALIDEEPEFSLDDYAPDQLDKDETKKK
jgi:uncharacterized protein (TIGR03503 family)